MFKIIVCLLIVCIAYIIGFCVGCSWIFKRNYNFTKEQCKRGDKFWRMFKVIDRWLLLRENNKSIDEYLIKMNYNHIAIYGMGYLGRHLVKELDESKIEIDYIIDKKKDKNIENITIYRPNDFLPDTNVIVVTAITDFDEIADELVEQIKCPIISFEDMIFDV